jgi:putative oxygen-independent coproporphyrinogen III oxidase
MRSDTFGIYVHIPFCKHRCHYCDFNTYEGQDDLHAAYVDALVLDIERWPREDRSVTSVFFGGGTPTLLSAGDLGRILETIDRTQGIASTAEVTVEANPETVDERTFRDLLASGFNRVSIGVQSLVPRVLLGLGRTHPPEQALDALGAAHAAGFTDVNADLIYGSPWETDEDWLVSLRGVIGAGPAHVSAYALTIEEGTPLATLVATGRVPDVDPDLQADRHAVADELLGSAGYERYEVSNWALPGHHSRHNVLYWEAGDYLGFGAGAHGHIAESRWWSTRLPRDFIAAVHAGHSTRAGSETLEEDARAGEALMLGLRLVSGIDLEQFGRDFGAESLVSRRARIDELARDGLVEALDDRLRLTPRGTMLASRVAAELL